MCVSGPMLYQLSSFLRTTNYLPDPVRKILTVLQVGIVAPSLLILCTHAMHGPSLIIFDLFRIHWLPVFPISHMAIPCHGKVICTIVWWQPSFIDKLVQLIKANERELVNCQTSYLLCGTICVRGSKLPKRRESRTQVTTVERQTPLNWCHNFLFRVEFTTCFRTPVVI